MTNGAQLHGAESQQRRGWMPLEYADAGMPASMAWGGGDVSRWLHASMT